jgi:aconitate decarboxylase
MTAQTIQAASSNTGTAGDGATAALTSWLAATSIDDVPAEVLDRALHLTLDGIGCALIGAKLPWSTRAVEAIGTLDGDGPATLIGWGRGLTPSAAALLNGTFIQGFEFDDKYGPLHSAAIIVPAALATAEATGVLDGSVAALSLVLGYEVGPRLGAALDGAALNKLGWSAGVFGALAAAATAARIRGLDDAGFDNALGNAATAASGVAADQFESMAKRMAHGFAARNGVVAAALAAVGYTGIKRVLERPRRGLITFCFDGETHVERVPDRLGEHWEQLNILIKPYASGGATHAAVDAMLHARNELGVHARDVQTLTIKLAAPTFRHNGWALERPATELQAQINIAYAAAVALLDGAAYPAQFRPDRIDADDVWELLARTSVVHDPEMDTTAGLARGTRVDVTLVDGTMHRLEVANALGTKRKPMSNEQVRAKFRAATAGVVSGARAAEIERLVLDLPSLDDITPLLRLLREPATPVFD